MVDTTRELVSRARRGDRDAVERLFALYRERIRGLVRRRLGEGLRLDLDSSDVVQSVCLEAFEALDRLDYHDEDGFVRWLARIAENTIRDKHRFYDAGKRRRPVGEPAASRADDRRATPSLELRRSERMALVLRALERLPEDYREVIRLVRLERRSHAEAATALGRSEQATRMLLSRARLRLAEELGAELGGLDD